jgi:hypothetical protein
LVGLLETSYSERSVRKIEEMFFFIHEEEKFPVCYEDRCEWYSKSRDDRKTKLNADLSTKSLLLKGSGVGFVF